MLAKALTDLDVAVYDQLDEPSSSNVPNIWEGNRQGVSNVACWVSTPSHASGWWKGQVPMISTMWEATKLPECFRENMHNFERIIVPSMQNLDLFSDYHPDVRYVPLGVDPERWHFQERQPLQDEFRFLIGGSGKRKGTDLAYLAFRKAFPNAGNWTGSGPAPVLLMKSPRGEEYYGPGIRIIGGRLSDQDEVDLYASAHCYLQPSRGEGFGLQPLQAIAQGCPTILTDAHGHEAFAHLGWGIGYTMTQSDYFIYGDAGDWWEPNLDELIDQMRWVYNHYAEAKVRAEVSSEIARDEFTWAKCATNFIDAIGGEEVMTSYEGPMEWHAPEMARFKVVIHQDWTADMAGKVYRFKKGVEYWETADVKRILFEAGLLDPCCIEIGDGASDLGLVETQLAQVEAYTASKSYCDTCGQKLGTGVTKSDEIYAGLMAATT